jgi:hypothetical protein
LARDFRSQGKITLLIENQKTLARDFRSQGKLTLLIENQKPWQGIFDPKENSLQIEIENPLARESNPKSNIPCNSRN